MIIIAISQTSYALASNVLMGSDGVYLTVCVAVRAAVERVDEAVDSGDPLVLLSALQNSSLALRGLIRDHAGWYLEQLSADREQKALVRYTHHTHTPLFSRLKLRYGLLCVCQDLGCVDALERDELQEGISVANEDAQRDRTSESNCTITYSVQ